MPIKPLTITDPAFFSITGGGAPTTDPSDTPTDTTGQVKEPKNRVTSHQVENTVPKNHHPQGLARLFNQLHSELDEPEEKVNIASATEQLEDLDFTPPKDLPAQAAVNQKIRFGLYDRISQTIAVENRGGGRSKVHVFEYVYGHLDFEIAIDPRGRLVIDPEKIVLPFGIFARVSHSESGSSASGGRYKFYDLAVVILSNGWIRLHSQLTGQKAHYAVVKNGNKIYLRRYIGPTPDGLEIIHTIAASEPRVRPFTVNPENHIVEPSDRRFAPRPTMRTTQVSPLPKPPAPQSSQDSTKIKPAVSPLSVSMDYFYNSLRQTAQLDTLVASWQLFQAANPVVNLAPTNVPTTKRSDLDRLLDGFAPEDRPVVIEILDSFARDLFGDFFGGRRRRRKKTVYSPVAPTQWYRR